MAHNIDYYISCLADYGIKRGLVDPDDRIFVINRILDRLGLHSYTEPAKATEELELEVILKNLLDFAAEEGIIQDSITFRDLFDTELMGIMTPLPSVVNKKIRLGL